MATDDMTFGADASRVLLELKKISREASTTQSAYIKLSQAIDSGVSKNVAGLNSLAKKWGEQQLQIRKATSELKGFEAAGAGVGMASNRMRMGLTQASFALDDFLSVAANQHFSMQGLAMGVRATSNNIGTLITSINPLAGVIATVGISLGTVLIPQIVNWASSSKDAAANIDLVTEALKKQREEAVKAEIGTKAFGERGTRAAEDAAVAEAAKATQEAKRWGLGDTMGLIGTQMSAMFQGLATETSLSDVVKKTRAAGDDAIRGKLADVRSRATQEAELRRGVDQARGVRTRAAAFSPFESDVKKRITSAAEGGATDIEGIMQGAMGPVAQGMRPASGAMGDIRGFAQAEVARVGAMSPAERQIKELERQLAEMKHDLDSAKIAAADPSSAGGKFTTFSEKKEQTKLETALDKLNNTLDGLRLQLQPQRVRNAQL